MLDRGWECLKRNVDYNPDQQIIRIYFKDINLLDL